MDMDIRWKQRFANYQKALGQLNSAVTLSKQRPLSELEAQGLIQAFEFTHELAWNVMKDYLIYQGYDMITGSRDAIRLAFQVGLITDGDGWMETIASRNKTSHTYDAATADALLRAITECYHGLFNSFETRMSVFL
jgi:nucleotidyltransferase substrate binding protein (TIGR01987 family)